MSQRKSTDYTLILIIVACVLALGYLIYSTYNLLHEEEESALTQTDLQRVSDLEYERDLEEPTETEYEEDLLDQPLLDDETPESALPPALIEEVDEDPMWDEPEDITPPTTPPPTTNHQRVPVGHYMVLAGSFRLKANADTQANRLRRMGYSDTTVEIFDRGTYAVVLVDHFPTYEAAQRLASELRTEGVEVLIQRQ